MIACENKNLPFQESDADLDRLEAKLKGLLLRGREDEVALNVGSHKTNCNI